MWLVETEPETEGLFGKLPQEVLLHPVAWSVYLFNPLDAMCISLNKQKLMYKPSIIAMYKCLWTYGGSGHIIYIYIYIYAGGLLRVNHFSKLSYVQVVIAFVLSRYIFVYPWKQKQTGPHVVSCNTKKTAIHRPPYIYIHTYILFHGIRVHGPRIKPN